MKKLFLAWQDPESRHWFPIGQLTFDGKNYRFNYIKGVNKAENSPNFRLLHSFPERDRLYTSSKLFPLFANRLMRPSRPDYQNYLQWLNISQNNNEPMIILARSGGNKATDTLEMFPDPEQDKDGVYQFYFFARGLRYMPESYQEKVKELQIKERLYLTKDFHNKYDSHALLLKTEQCYNLGYCPRYIATDIAELLKHNPSFVRVFVERINPIPTPIQLRLLCSMRVKRNNNYVPFSSSDYQPVVDYNLSLEYTS